MNYTDFTSCFQAADKASLSAQKSYLNIIRVDLISLIVASALSIYNYQQIQSKEYIYWISFLLLLLSLVLTIVLKTKKYEDLWYQGRALAESCKTLVWRFVCCSEYFEKELDPNICEQRFVERINGMIKECPEMSKVMDSRIINLPYITDKMKEIRNMTLPQRKQYYIDYRVEDQKKWYSQKAEFNKGRYNVWFWVIIITQAAALIAVGFLIKYPDSNWNWVGLLTTSSAAALSWLQIKQHQELKQAYTTATQELNSIVALVGQVNSEEALSRFVLDSENAISREHTLWLAQRRK